MTENVCALVATENQLKEYKFKGSIESIAKFFLSHINARKIVLVDSLGNYLMSFVGGTITKYSDVDLANDVSKCLLEMIFEPYLPEKQTASPS